MAQNSGSLKIRKDFKWGPRSESQSTTLSSGRIEDESTLGDTVQVYWCNNPRGMIQYCPKGLEVGPALKGGRILSYKVTCAYNESITLRKSPARGGKLSAQIREAIEYLPPGGTIYFDYIRVFTADRKVVKVKTLTFTKWS